MAIWKMVRDAVKAMGGKATIPQIKQYFIKNHPNIIISNIDPATREITVNAKSRTHYGGGKQLRRTNTNNQYDCLFQNTDGYFEIYAPQKHGVWEIFKDEKEKLSIRLIEKINSEDNDEHEDFLPSNSDMTTKSTSPRNQILFGPPGTGKTYNTINEALRILEPSLLDQPNVKRQDLLDAFNSYTKAGQIVFCTFHQSFSYEDFVEGLRANSVDGQIEYRVESGLFKQICERAVVNDASIDEALQQFIAQVTDKPMSLKTQRGQPFYVSHKSGHKGFHCALEESPDLYIAQPSIEDIRKLLNGIKPGIYAPYVRGIAEYIIKQLIYDENFSSKNKSMDDLSRKRFVLIIDEINRGNISKIFGELITLIEPSKRAGKDEALSVMLPYSKEIFSVPDNVYLIGTMNTADRSLASLDIALRRRFEFVEMPPRPDSLNKMEINGVNIGELLSVMNERIEVLLGHDHCLGHAYFMSMSENSSVEDLADIFRRQIIPLLQEYFFEDWQRISWVLNDQRKELANRFLIQTQSNLLELFGDENGSRFQDNRWQLNQEAFERIEAYAGVINHEAKIKASVAGREVVFAGLTVRQLETGTIEILNGETMLKPVYPKLKEMAASLSISILNSQDKPYNTRQLGKVVIDAVEARA